MEKPKTNGMKLKKAIDKFGSLQKAIEQIEEDKATLEKQNAQLCKENAQLKLTRENLLGEMKELEKKNHEKETEYEVLANKIKQHSYQYELFEGFLAMVVGSPSVTAPIQALIATFRNLSSRSWQSTGKTDDLRSIFVRTVLGDYLNCFRCNACGAKFIVNKDSKYKFFGTGYQCPVCYRQYPVKEDDSFLKAMVSEEQLKNTRRIAEVMKENEALKPLKQFQNIHCELCGKPITEWSEDNVKIAADGFGWGHTRCWNTNMGTVRLILNGVRLVRKS